MIKNKLHRHTSIYFIGEVLIFAGGFISFPIFTRLLTKEEYGIMNLISIAMLLAESISSLGLRHAALRFNDSNDENFRTYYSTLFFGSFAFAIVGTIAVYLIVYLLALAGLINDMTRHVFFLAALLIIARVMTKIIGSIYRVKENAIMATLTMILNKYAGMFLSIYLVAIYLLGVWGFYLGLVIGEIAMTILAVYLLIKSYGAPALTQYQTSKLREMSAYGIPMMLSGFAAYILTMVDRYMIAFYESAEQVANYSVPYNLCTYISAAIVTAFQSSLLPIVMNSWNNNRMDEVHSNMQNVIKSYMFISIPVIFGVVALGADMLRFMASDKYADTSNLIVYFILSEIIFGFVSPVMIGLQFEKKTNTILKITFFAALLNFCLNLVLIPLFSLQGAAIATLLSIITLLAMSGYESFKYYKITFPWLTIFKYLLCAIIMYVMLLFTRAEISRSLLVTVPSGMFVYGLAILAIDKEVRTFAVRLYRRA